LTAVQGETVAIRFTGVTGNGYESDMAIDDIYFGELWVPTPTPTRTPTNTPTPTHTPTVTPTGTPTWAPQPVVMVTAAAGNFQMGSPPAEMCRASDEDLHEVILSHGFLIQENEATQAQWLMVFDVNPSVYYGEFMPVDAITWFDACAFCNRMSLHDGYTPVYYEDPGFTTMFDGTPPIRSGTVYWKPDADGYRLPTEAEWEYACRAGTVTAYNNGTDPIACNSADANLDPLAWYEDNAGGVYHDVELKDPNAWILFDMHGNVREWCWDWYESAYPAGPVTDPLGPADGTQRVIRSGYYFSYAKFCRSAARFKASPGSIIVGQGIRFARNAPSRQVR
ncbi:MAG TPA: formylglycine-generating enzyme family protein, partial [bacterium]|nr:formylglycine-generating enzyme family protein [bacterium]